MQYSKDQVEQKRITLNDPTWRQPPLLIVNVSFICHFVAFYFPLKTNFNVDFC